MPCCQNASECVFKFLVWIFLCYSTAIKLANINVFSPLVSVGHCNSSIAPVLLYRPVMYCKLVGGSSIDDIDCVVCVFYGCVPDAGYIYGVVD
jgi:hypothetical protein